MRNFSRVNTVLGLVLLSATLAPMLALAQQNCTTASGFVQLACTPSGALSNLYSSQGDLSSFINSLFKFAIAIGAIGAVLRLVYAGYLYMGSDLWNKKSQAKQIMSDVTIGLLLLLGIWLILYQINPDIVSLSALKTITPPQTQSQ